MRKGLSQSIQRFLQAKPVFFLVILILTGACTLKKDTIDKQPVGQTYPLIHEDGSKYFNIDARAAVGTSSAIIERNLLHALTSLRLIASAPATRSGIWPEIRPALQTLCDVIPGAALYIQPDGNYYSVEQGFTGLNLSDRSYFRPLFEGNEVHGSLIYSRSTGKKSVLMAVPSFEDGEVTGAVALSIFLDDFQELISKALNLDPDYLWYVLNEEGNTVLHPRSDFVFLSPAEQGSPSMIEAVEAIVTNDRGYTSYKFAGRNTHILFQEIPFNNWRMVLGKIGEPIEEEYLPEAYEVLTKIKSVVLDELKKMDRNLDKMVQSYNGQIPAEHIVRNSFQRFYENNPYVISCALIDPDGTIVYAEPSEFHLSQGRSIRDQENFFIIQKNRAPMLSNSFLAIEGFDAVSLQYPIIDSQGTFFGLVSILIRPDVMVEELSTPIVAETLFEPWVMEPDGRILFDKSYAGTGRMIHLDYLYEEKKTFRQLGEMITQKKTGKGDYIHVEPKTNESVVKMAIWDTIELHDAQWRIIVSYPPYD